MNCAAPNKNKRAEVRETLETHSDCTDAAPSTLRAEEKFDPEAAKGQRPPRCTAHAQASQTLTHPRQFHSIQRSYCKYRSPERVRKERERSRFSVYEPQQVWRLLEEQLDSAVIISPLPPATRTQNR